MLEDLNYIYDGLSDADKDKFHGSDIVVTGAGGFIGYYLLNFLTAFSSDLEINNILALDTFILGKPEWIDSLSKRFDLFHIKKFDVAKDNVEEIPGIDRYDSIIHMASIASPTYYRKHPLATLDANVWGLRKMLDYFAKRNPRGFLNFSSSEVYGDPDASKVPMNEEYYGNVAFNGPRACYDESKRFGETMCYVFNMEFDMKVVSVRPFNNYGPGMKLNDARAPADFASSVVKMKAIEIFSDGSATRTFTYISDAIVGYLKALYYGKFDYFNIGMDSPEITISQLARIFAEEGEKIFNYKTEIRYMKSSDVDYLVNNPKRRVPDITKAREKLGFDPKVTVQNGVARFLQYLREEMTR
ncbi:NAD-dependent epimerase/dehydratase family protein [Thermoplasmatales archaeon AK]|nr:NAD-dependent epimerase/dehydratase family protein [Thermoplasmatales archaeon AK]